MNELLKKFESLTKEKELHFGNLTVYNDTTGELIQKYLKWHQNEGVTTKVFSTFNLKISNCYNPFDYVYDENKEIDDAKVMKVVSLFLTKEGMGTGSDPYYDKICEALLTSVVYYMLEMYQNHPEDISFSSLLDIVRCAHPFPSEDNPETKLDKMMLEAKKNNKLSKAWDWYEIYKTCPTIIANGIVIGLAVDLQMFGDESIKSLVKHDYTSEDNNLNLYELEKGKAVLYINTPPANSTFDFLVRILYTQLIDIFGEPAVIEILQGSSRMVEDLTVFNEKHADYFDIKTEHNPNYILAEKLYKSNDKKKSRINHNILLVGGTGSGKTEQIKENILLGNTSMVINDPDGYLFTSCKNALEEKGFKVQMLSDVDFVNSARYNPFDYIYYMSDLSKIDLNGEPDLWKIDDLVQIIVSQILGSDLSQDRMKCVALVNTIIYASMEMYGKNQLNFSTIWELVKKDLTDFETYINALDRKESNFWCYNIYTDEFNEINPEAKKDLWNKTKLFFHQFALNPLKSLTTPDTKNDRNNIHFQDLLNEKVALFIKSGTWEKPNDFIYKILYSQIFDYMINNQKVGNEQNRIQFYLDEMQSIGDIPNFAKDLSLCISRNVGCTISIQDISQLKKCYGSDWEVIIANCDTIIYMGHSASIDTCNYVSQLAGTTTISRTSATNKFISKTLGGNWTKNRQSRNKMSYRPLIDPSEIAHIDQNKCIVKVRGENPILADKIKH